MNLASYDILKHKVGLYLDRQTFERTLREFGTVQPVFDATKWRILTWSVNRKDALGYRPDKISRWVNAREFVTNMTVMLNEFMATRSEQARIIERNIGVGRTHTNQDAHLPW